MDSNKEIIRSVLITEKASLVKLDNRYVFRVIPDAHKSEIKTAVENFFKVKVLSVNTVFCRGKEAHVGRSKGKKSSWKKAYVKLAPGQKIDLLDKII